MAKRTPPSPNYPAWSTAKFFSFIRSGLRQKWMRWPPKFEVLKDARIDVTGQGRTRFNYKCSKCEGYFKQKEVEVDHIVAAGKLNSFEDIGGFCERLFVSKEKLRVVCKPCHKKITAAQKVDRV
jgi:DNA-directed RNA polymerase subunit RPC12/RpoP